MYLLINPLLLATLAAIMAISSTQDQGQRQSNCLHPHINPLPLVTASRLWVLSTCGGAERKRWERWNGWVKGGHWSSRSSGGEGNGWSSWASWGEGCTRRPRCARRSRAARIAGPTSRRSSLHSLGPNHLPHRPGNSASLCWQSRWDKLCPQWRSIKLCVPAK